MTAGLGLKVGSTTSIAVSTVPNGVPVSEPEHFVSLVRATALELEPGRAPVLTSSASGSALTGFAARVGDPVALVADDGRSFTGDELYATALECLAAETEIGDGRTVVIAYPTHWQNYTVERLRDAAAEHGLADVTFVPEAIASVAWLGRTRGSTADGLVVVYDLGGSALEVTLVRTGTDSKVVGRSTRSDDVSGAQFDHLVMQHVLGSIDADHLDPFDPDTEAALAVLRTRCSVAKETLSSDTEAVVHVELPSIDTDVRVVRSEVEDLLREPLLGSLDVVREAIRSAGVEPSDVTRVLLTGGGASVPLVAELISSMLRVPVTADAAPATTSATGAAVLATEVGSAASAIDAATAAPEDVRSTALAVRAPSEPAVRAVHTPAPVSRVAAANHRAPMSRGRRIALVAATTAAIAILAAGGLSVGTMLTSNDTPTDATTADTSAVTSPTTTPATDAAGTTPAATDATAGTSGSAAAPGVAGADSPSSAEVAPGAAAGTAPVDGTGAPAAGNTGSTGNTGAAPTVPNVQLPAAPAYTPPAYTPPAIPTQLPTVANPLPGVVNGTVDGLGNVVNGTGNVLGGVVNGVTGLGG